MVLAKPAGRKPRELAALLAERLAGVPGVSVAEIAGPGFINLRLDAPLWQDCLRAILEQGTAYGASGIGGGRSVNVEYVSANPTGPLHIGPVRGTGFGAVPAPLLGRIGYVSQLGRAAGWGRV